MAAEEDKKFDAVLGGFLVNDLRIRAGHLHCPESDTLAAYHERSLLPEEMNSWKEHIVGCARCQAILAELEATDSIPLQVSEEEVVVAAAAAPTAVVGQGDEAATTKTPEKSRVTPISRGVRWQWLAPAGAVAAGMLLWVAWHENRSQLNAPSEVKTARLEPPAAPPVTRDGRETVSADEMARVSKDQSAVGGAVAAKPAPQTEGLKQFEKSDAHAKVALAKPTTRESAKQSESSIAPSDKEAGARADTALASAEAANRAQGQPAQDDKAGVAGVASQTVEVETLTANAQQQNQQAQQNLQAQNQLNEQKVSGPNPSRVKEAMKKRKSGAAGAPPPVPSAPAAFAGNIRATSSLAVADFAQPVISAPGAKNLWRVGHLGMIEFSGDGGASWSRQVSNVSVELTAGSAPSEKVCWIVGQAGTILLTTDAGAHWVTIHSPLNDDLGGVRATDSAHATIWNLDKTRLFETSDGGAAWKPAVSQ